MMRGADTEREAITCQMGSQTGLARFCSPRIGAVFRREFNRFHNNLISTGVRNIYSVWFPNILG